MAETKTLAELADHPEVKGAAKVITAAAKGTKPQFDLIAEAKVAMGLERSLNYAQDAYKIPPGGTTLTDREQTKYADIVEKFSKTGDRENLKAFTDALRSLNGESEETRTKVSGALLAHGAKAGRNGISLMASTLVHVHGANDIQFKAHVQGERDAVSMPIKELVKRGTLSDSGNLPKWDETNQAYLETRIQQAQESAKKLYPKEHGKAVPHK